MLGGLLLAVFILGVPYLLISHTRLKSQVATLQRQVNALLGETGRQDMPAAQDTARPSPW